METQPPKPPKIHKPQRQEILDLILWQKAAIAVGERGGSMIKVNIPVLLGMIDEILESRTKPLP